MSKSIIQRVYAIGLYALVFCSSALLSGCDSDPPLSTQPIPSSVATLSSLTTSIAGYPNAFGPEVFAYSTSVPLSTDTLLIRATASDTSASVLIHDPEFVGQSFELATGATYGPANLSVGPNIFVVEVIAPNLTTTLLYTLNIERFPSGSTPL